MSKPFWIVSFALAAMVLSSPNEPRADIGSVAAVNQDMDGTRPSSEKRRLSLGDRVISNERIETSDIGSGQLLFLDNTSLTVAPNSDVVLDRYVFDPERSTGDVALSLTVGAIRFVGGAITKGKTATIRTPTATVGIRGGSGIVVVLPDGSTKATFLFGKSMTITQYGDADGDNLDDGKPAGTDQSEGQGEGLSGPSSESRITVTRNGGTVETNVERVIYLGPVSTEELKEFYVKFEGTGDGGLREALNSQTVNDGTAGVTAQNSGAPGGTKKKPGQADGGVKEAEEEGLEADPSFIIQSLPSASDDMTGMTIAADPAALAALTGFATYTGIGTAIGVLTDLSDPSNPVATNVAGNVTLGYFFETQTGSLEIDIINRRFTTDVEALPVNPTIFAGSDTILNNPDDTFTAAGQFLTTVGSPDPASSVDGAFIIDLGSEQQIIEGAFDASR